MILGLEQTTNHIKLSLSGNFPPIKFIRKQVSSNTICQKFFTEISLQMVSAQRV